MVGLIETPSQRFPALDAVQGTSHAFLLRQPGIDVACDRDEALARLRPGFESGIRAFGAEPAEVATAEQVHGGDLAEVGQPAGLGAPIPGVDGLLTRRRGAVLGIYVADCCAVYLTDKRGRGIALVHSGRKGTEAGIAPAAVRALGGWGIDPADLIVQLSPCIRPPAYEVDFAAEIRRSCAAAGVPAEQIHDDRTCTARDLARHYSYRAERGRTGRMLALLAMRE